VTTTYRYSKKTVIGFAVAMLTTLLGVAYGIVSNESLDDQTAAIALGIAVVVIAVVILRFVRTATIASAEALVARRFLWTDRVAWSRVQAIIIETTVSLRDQDEHERAVAYLDNRRRLALPGVTDGTVDTPEAVQALRGLWYAGRGPAWQPAPDVQRAADQRARRPSAVVLVIRWVKIGIGVTAGVWIVLILLKALPPQELRLPIGLGVAAVIAVIGLVVEGVRGRSLPVATANTGDAGTRDVKTSDGVTKPS
jgi:hypothetical protein